MEVWPCIGNIHLIGQRDNGMEMVIASFHVIWISRRRFANYEFKSRLDEKKSETFGFCHFVKFTLCLSQVGF